jgi:5'(3')-deoxyribonucleotidase
LLVISDVDDTLANFVPRWIERFNSEWHQDLTLDQITDWDIGQFLKNSEYKKYLYGYLEDPSLYDNVEPIKDSLWGINKLRKMGHRVIFVTSTPSGQIGRKYIWLKDNGFITSKEDYYEAHDKSVFRGEWIIDDRFSTVSVFRGKGILFERNWNKKEQWNLKAKNWKQVINIIKSIGDF